MNLPFIRFFKKEKSDESSVAVAPRTAASIDKPASERGKTVMPNSSRIVGLEPTGNFSAPTAASSPARTVPTVSRKISLGASGSIVVGPKPAPSGTATERTIALPLTDLIPNIPSDLLKPVPVDPERQVLLKASEVERGMATGRPTVLLRAIYKQAPEFFTSEVAAGDLREVSLPFTKVVEQFASFQVRDDQIADQECPQLETPFLQVTLEDSERFGMPLTPPVAREAPAIQTKAITEVKPEAVAQAKPEVVAPAPAATAAAPKPIAPMKFSGMAPASASAPAPVPAPASAPAPEPAVKASLSLDQLPASPPLSAKISPNGTGVPAAERVPASSGSPVPTPLPSPLAPLPPTRIPFKVNPPSSDLRPASKSLAPRASQESREFSTPGPRISLPLRNILRHVAPFQLSGPIDAVSDTAVIEIPFSIIEPQLSLGRVAISPAQFRAALPEEHRALFEVDPAGTPVPLSLEEVLQNLPDESLQLRGDQEELEVAETFETPFSQKASEDAARMKVAAGPIGKTTAAATEAKTGPVAASTKTAAKPVPAPAKLAPKAASASTEPAAQATVTLPKEAPVALAKKTPQPAPAPKEEVAPATKPAAETPVAAATERPIALPDVLVTESPLDAKSAVAQVNRLAGVSACAIVFSDGLSLAGNIPADYEADALCAMAPSIVKRIGEQMVGAKLGALQGLTLYCAKTPVSLFAQGNICLAAIHSGGEIAAEVRDRIGRITQELALLYAQKPNA